MRIVDGRVTDPLLPFAEEALRLIVTSCGAALPSAIGNGKTCPGPRDKLLGMVIPQAALTTVTVADGLVKPTGAVAVINDWPGTSAFNLNVVVVVAAVKACG